MKMCACHNESFIEQKTANLFFSDLERFASHYSPGRFTTMEAVMAFNLYSGEMPEKEIRMAVEALCFTTDFPR